MAVSLAITTPPGLAGREPARLEWCCSQGSDRMLVKSHPKAAPRPRVFAVVRDVRSDRRVRGVCGSLRPLLRARPADLCFHRHGYILPEIAQYRGVANPDKHLATTAGDIKTVMGDKYHFVSAEYLCKFMPAHHCQPVCSSFGMQQMPHLNKKAAPIVPDKAPVVCLQLHSLGLISSAVPTESDHSGRAFQRTRRPSSSGGVQSAWTCPVSSVPLCEIIGAEKKIMLSPDKNFSRSFQWAPSVHFSLRRLAFRAQWPFPIPRCRRKEEGWLRQHRGGKHAFFPWPPAPFQRRCSPALNRNHSVNNTFSPQRWYHELRIAKLLQVCDQLNCGL